MDLSFQQKSLWLMLVSLVGAFGLYFGAVLPSHALEIQPHQLVLFVLAVILMVILQVAGHIVIAIVDRRSETDERDRLISLKGTRYGSFVLASGVFFALCAAVLMPGNFVFTHVLLAFWVLAQLVEIGSQLYLYRRGV
jgi:cytochrome b subunit of formate dehydrogenase